MALTHPYIRETQMKTKTQMIIIENSFKRAGEINTGRTVAFAREGQPIKVGWKILTLPGSAIDALDAAGILHVEDAEIVHLAAPVGQRAYEAVQAWAGTATESTGPSGLLDRLSGTNSVPEPEPEDGALDFGMLRRALAAQGSEVDQTAVLSLLSAHGVDRRRHPLRRDSSPADLIKYLSLRESGVPHDAACEQATSSDDSSDSSDTSEVASELAVLQKMMQELAAKIG